MATTQGSTVWLLAMQGWGLQVDELVDSGHYAEALMLLQTIDQAALKDKVCQYRAHIAVELTHDPRCTLTRIPALIAAASCFYPLPECCRHVLERAV